jgi:Ser/Thr protein kinase RdoA (MazF antagonist)
VLSEETVSLSLERHWGLRGAWLTRLDGGMGSRTWIVDHGDRRWVLKAVVAANGDQFASGLVVAELLERAGIAAGAAEPALHGALTVAVDGYRLGLLTWVPGRALTGEDEGQRELIGTTLGQVHLVLSGHLVPGMVRFHWVDPGAGRLSLRPWLRPAVAGAVAALDRLGPGALVSGPLHADPAPEAFLRDQATGRCGLIDWGSAVYGPLLYDLASAVMYLGGPGSAARMVGAYLATGALSRSEVEQGLDVMLSFRWAVQADYFAWRITENDLTGISGPKENEKGLEDARQFLVGP